MNDFFQQTAQQEFAQAQREFSSAKQVTQALHKSFARQDKLIASTLASSTTQPACRAGCAFCCYYKVEVRAHEVLAIKEYLHKNASAALLQQVQSNVAHNAQTIRSLTPEQHLQTNLPCALLQDNQCSIYPVRPYRCRHFHATDASACEASFADPANMNIATGMIEALAIATDAHSQGFEASVEQQGLDMRVYDFTTALQETLSDPDCSKRYQRGKKTFKQALVVE